MQFPISLHDSFGVCAHFNDGNTIQDTLIAITMSRQSLDN